MEVMRGALAGSVRRYEPSEEDRSIEMLIEKRSRRGEDDAQESEEGWRESVREYHEDRSELLKSLWAIHYRRLARNHARLSEANAAKAAALMETNGKETS